MPNPAGPPIRDDISAPSEAPTVPFLLRCLPGLGRLRCYRREWLGHDVVAGLSVCVVMIPSVIAYAQLMGLPPQNGLYAALVPLVIYALIGSSRQMIVGPDIAISLLIASTIGPLARGDPRHAAVLAGALALLSGLLLLLGARANLGAVADFLAKPVLVGYMTGAALILMGSQLNKLFGVTLRQNDFFPRLLELAGKLHETHSLTLALGLGLLILLIGLHRFAPRFPAVLIVCTVAAAASTFWGLEKRGVAVVGTFPAGLPALSVPAVPWQDLQLLLPAAIGIALLTYTEGILLARAFAAKNGYEVVANQELSALGVADLAAGLFQGFSITGSQARTTINEGAGARSQLSSLVAAGALCLFLIFLTPLIARLPQVALAASLIFAGFSLIEFDLMVRIYRFYPSSSVVAALTTLSVLAAGVVPGIIFGVALSLLGLINRISRPPDAILSAVPGRGFHDLGVTETQTVPGLIAYRFYAPLLFSNAGHFAERVRQLITKCPQKVRWFLLDAQAITDIDVTAVETLHTLHEELRAQGIALKIAHANRPLRQLLERTGLAAEIGQQSFFPSVHEAIAAFSQTGAGQVPTRNSSKLSDRSSS
ncbi:MAG TPA: sulfate permease [Candidatus Limnocylindrales bacterium]|nr:sulfate permease [Candidatus Limnocylindrales bacterium]